MCDQDHVSFFTCPHCSTCQVSKTWGDFPVHVTGKKGQLDVYCSKYINYKNYIIKRNLY